MSVGVCIINKNGIALAADSAGTVGENKMFYNSMNKVYNLSFNNKIGAITYGSTVICNTPIEIILKEYRKYIDENYKDIIDFFSLIEIFKKFLSEKSSYFQFEKSEEMFCSEFIQLLIEKWGEKINKNVQNVDSDKVEEKIAESLEEIKIYIDSFSVVPEFDVAEYIKTTYEENIINNIKCVSPVLFEHEKQFNSFVQYVCKYFNLYLKMETKQPLGLLFAGYDSQSAFPKYINIEIYNFIGGKLKYKVEKRFDGAGYRSSILPLAQSDIIDTFIQGYSNNFMNAIPELIKSEIDKRVSLINSEKGEISKKFNDIQDSIIASLKTKFDKEYVNPLLNNLHVLQIPDLASLAESLVNITSLKRKFSMDGYQQTVGGPTDVAAISANDGFIWIKRKHYFDKELNPHFIQKYK